MAEAKKAQASYGNESISALKGADRVRKRPGVIFGSDGLEGCEHAVFEILSNSIDEARRALAPSSPSPGSWTTAWRWRTRAGAARWTTTRRRSGGTGSWCSASSTPGASTATTRGRTTSSPWGSTAWAPAPPSTPPPTWTSPCGGTGTSTSSTSKGQAPGQEGPGAAEDPPVPEEDRHQDPVAAGPGGLHRHRHPGGVLHLRHEAPGGGQRRGDLPLQAGDRPGEVRDHGVSLPERHR